MSADSEIEQMLNDAGTSATDLSSSSSSLLSTAMSALNYSILFNDSPSFSSSIDSSKYNDLNTTINFSSFPKLNLGNLPSTQDAGTISIGSGFPQPPILNLPSFDYPKASSIKSLDNSIPDIRSSLAIPSPPSAYLPSKVVLLNTNTINPINIDFNAPSFQTIPEIGSFDDGTYKETLDHINDKIFDVIDELSEAINTQCKTTLNAILPHALEAISTRILNPYTDVLLFHDKLKQRLDQRISDERERVNETLNSRSGWELPAAVANAFMDSASRIASAWTQQAESQVNTQSAELASEMLRLCGSLMNDLSQVVQDFRRQEIVMTLDAHKFALSYAKLSIASLFEKYDAEQFITQDLHYQQAEAKLKVFELELTVAMFKYEVANVMLQAEELKQDNDASLIQNYRSEIEVAESNIKVYASLVSASRKELEIARTKVEQFALSVKAFDAQVNANEAQINAQVAEIEGDAARVKGELVKVEGYEKEAQAFEEIIAAKQKLIEAESDINAAIIDEFSMKAKAQLAEVDKIALENSYELKKYIVTVNNQIDDSKIKLAIAKSDLDYMIQKQQGILKAYEFSKEYNTDSMQSTLTHHKAIAQINEIGAGILGNMAQGAMSVANGIAVATLKETE